MITLLTCLLYRGERWTVRRAANGGWLKLQLIWRDICARSQLRNRELCNSALSSLESNSKFFITFSNNSAKWKPRKMYYISKFIAFPLDSYSITQIQIQMLLSHHLATGAKWIEIRSKPFSLCTLVLSIMEKMIILKAWGTKSYNNNSKHGGESMVWLRIGLQFSISVEIYAFYLSYRYPPFHLFCSLSASFLGTSITQPCSGKIL